MRAAGGGVPGGNDLLAGLDVREGGLDLVRVVGVLDDAGQQEHLVAGAGDLAVAGLHGAAERAVQDPGVRVGDVPHRLWRFLPPGVPRGLALRVRVGFHGGGELLAGQPDGPGPGALAALAGPAAS